MSSKIYNFKVFFITGALIIFNIFQLFGEYIKLTEEHGYYQDAELYFDTTGIGESDIKNHMHESVRYYAKDGWIIWSKEQIVDLPKLPKDSVVIISNELIQNKFNFFCNFFLTQVLFKIRK